MHSQEEVGSGNLQLCSRNFLYGLLKKSQRKRLILINYSAKIFEMANINVRKRQTSSVNYSLSIAREETPRQAKPEAAAPPKYTAVCRQQTTDSLIPTSLQTLDPGPSPRTVLIGVIANSPISHLAGFYAQNPRATKCSSLWPHL